MKHSRHLIIMLVLVLLPFGALIVVNAFDYYRFSSAVRRVEKLTPAELTALADYSRNVTGHQKHEGDQVPEPFRGLHPIEVSLGKDLAYANLYQAGEVYLQCNIDTSPSNQQIHYFTNSSGRQRRKILWNRNPEFVRKTNPDGRLVTVAQWSMSHGTRWIVLPSRILVVRERSTTGSEPKIEAVVPLADEGLAEIRNALISLGPDVRGKDYRSDHVMDGISLRITFTSTGEAGADDISISNTWTPAVKPLLDTISKLVPPAQQIRFGELMTTDEHLRDYPTTVRTLEEWETTNSPPPQTPWWCVWRSFDR